MKELKIFSSRPEAEMLQNVLQENGIPSMIRADDCGGTQPALLVNTGVILLVNDEDFEEAKEYI